jgi:hypothetical protein
MQLVYDATTMATMVPVFSHISSYILFLYLQRHERLKYFLNLIFLYAYAYASLMQRLFLLPPYLLRGAKEPNWVPRH